MPTCRECDIKMAIHMDDPPWDIFGLPRLLVDAESIDRFLSMVDDEYNCLTLCSGSLNANPNNNVAEIVRKHCDRIAFAHIRNIHHFPNGDFSEAAHRDCCGETGIIEILRAYHDCGFEGYIRPDHGRQLWEEGPGNCRPGYGKYDRASACSTCWVSGTCWTAWTKKSPSNFAILKLLYNKKDVVAIQRPFLSGFYCMMSRFAPCHHCPYPTPYPFHLTAAAIESSLCRGVLTPPPHLASARQLTLCTSR